MKIFTYQGKQSDDRRFYSIDVYRDSHERTIIILVEICFLLNKFSFLYDNDMATWALFLIDNTHISSIERSRTKYFVKACFVIRATLKSYITHIIGHIHRVDKDYCFQQRHTLSMTIDYFLSLRLIYSYSNLKQKEFYSIQRKNIFLNVNFYDKLQLVYT